MTPFILLLSMHAAFAGSTDTMKDPFAAMKGLYRKIEAEVDPRLNDNDFLGAVEASRKFVQEETDVAALRFLLDLRSSYLAAAGMEAEARFSMLRSQSLALGSDAPPEQDAVRGKVRWEEPEAVLREAAKTHSVIMISEAHHVAETRAFGGRVLPLLRSLGFEVLAMEALKHPVPENASRVSRSTAADAVSGYYLMEPQMAGLVREARRLGFRLVAYEDETTGGGDREQIQAQNLYERVFKEKPDAKLVVWAGYGHIYKRSPFGAKMMAQWLWEMTGREPFCLYQVADSLDPHRTDHPFYKPLVLDDPKRPKRALVLRNRGETFLDRAPDGKPSVDGYVVHPPFKPRAAGSLRPAWVARKGLVKAAGVLAKDPDGPVMVQAFFAAEGTGSTPADQMLCRNTRDFELWLEPGEYILRVRDAGGRVLSESRRGIGARGAYLEL